MIQVALVQVLAPVNGPGIRLIPGHMDLDTGLSPGAPVNNCRWASTHMSWDQSDPAGMGGALCIDPEAASYKPQATSYKLDNG